MAQTTTLNLISNLPHTGASGMVNTYTGTPKQAAAYYLGNADLQTITWGLSSLFAGVILVQATLKDNPGENDWFEVYNINSSSNKTGFFNLQGNFVWLRATVSAWTDGTIEVVAVSY